MNPFIQDLVAEAVRRQPWYQKNANTIVAGLVMLSAVLSFIATLGMDLPPMVAGGIPVVVTALGTIVTKLTRNGVQPSMVPKLAATETARKPAPGATLLAAEIARVRESLDYVGQHRAE